MAAAAGGDASVVGEVHLSPLARMRHEEFELRRDLEAAIACGDAPLVNRFGYELGLALHRRAGARCGDRHVVQRVAAALLGRARDAPGVAVDRSLVAVACYRAWSQLGPRGPLSLLHASDASWDAADDESIPTLALIERVRVQQLVGKHAEAAATLGVVLDREDLSLIHI